MINPIIVRRVIEEAIIEDNHYIDVTTDMLVDKNNPACAVMSTKQEGIICGVDIVKQCFQIFDDTCWINVMTKEGERVKEGREIMQIKGDAQAILKAERIALNFIQRMSGIATMAHQYVSALNNCHIKLVDTRKTTPNFRIFEKYAVTVGGAFNHRYNTSDCVMIKDNHIKMCGGIKNAVLKVKKKLGHTVKIEVEVATLMQLHEALAVGADIIMLDNMSLEEMEQAVEITEGKVVLEASGNITLDRLPALGKLAIDAISVGALTHSYQALDISLNIIL